MNINDLYSVKDKVVIITGGGRGIGKMIADGFVTNGAKVYIASRDLKALTATAKELTAKGPGKCVAIQAGLTTEAGCKALADEIKKHETKVDVLINNSGVAYGGTFDMHTSEVWDKVLGVNVKTPFFLVRELLPLLDAAATSPDGARVINIGSVAGLRTQNIPTPAYDVSKAAVHHLTRALAAKLSRRPNGGHILVNAIAPGLVPTKMASGIAVATSTPLEQLQEFIPVGRYGNEFDMAGLAIFLASKASGWISGMTIASDGGQIFASETTMGTPKL